MPSVNEGDEVILPKEHTNAVLFAKESEYSFKAHISDFFQLKYTSWPLAFAERYEFFVKLVSKDLTDTLKSKAVAESLAEEARSCLSDVWGEDTDNWVEVPLYSFMEKAAARMVNVLAIGPGRSHDSGLLNAMTNCSNAIVFGANVIKAFPSFLHPYVQRLSVDSISSNCKQHYRSDCRSREPVARASVPRPYEAHHRGQDQRAERGL
jgi:hypothetical protein